MGILMYALSPLNIQAQDFSASLGFGFANYGGDLQDKRFTLQQAKTSISGAITYAFNSRWSVRGEYTFAKVGADDQLSSKVSHQNRNLNFSSNIFDYSLTAHYNFFDIEQRRITPYVFGGIGTFKFSPYTYDDAGNKVFLIGLNTEGQGLAQYPNKKPTKQVQLNIPFGTGLKMMITEKLGISFELGFRKTFTDYIDDVSGTYADGNLLLNNYGQLSYDLAYRGASKTGNPYPAEGSIRGNSRAKDYYYTGMLKLHVHFPGKNTSSKYGCPKKPV